MKNHNFSLNPLDGYRVFSLLFVLFTSTNFHLVAQKTATFIADGKNIDISTFDESIRQMIDEAGISGMSLAIIENGQIAYTNAYGVKERKTSSLTDKKTVFEAASLTKIFLVYVVHKLVDQGLLDLDKPMHEYLSYPALEHDDRYKLITPRMIMSHSSGIENWRWLNDEKKLEILSSPGEKFVYSGEGFHYLADVVETILDKPYEHYVNEMIIEPFDLEDTYLRYDSVSSTPSNYAVGYDFFGNEIEKWKNISTVPASGNHLTAEDFSKLIINTFNGKNLSGDRINDMTKDHVKMAPGSSDQLYISAGFMLNYEKKDTVVSFAGSNEGYKAWFSYSTVNHRGIVFLTNSDIGVSALKKLNELTVNLPLKSLLTLLEFPQYPSDVFPVLSAFNEGGTKAMLERVSTLHKTNEGGVEFKALDLLSTILFKKDAEAAKSLMLENAKLHTENPMAFYNIGQMGMHTGQYQLAYDNFKKCKELEGDFDDLEESINYCKEKLNN